MPKTLSQQLCELCGLEYEKKYSYFVKKHPDKEISEGVPKEVEGVLDFKNPENFVKLLELKPEPENNGMTIWSHVNGRCRSFKNSGLPYYREHFLEELVLLLVNAFMYGSEEQIETIKQSIRNYDGWVWG